MTKMEAGVEFRYRGFDQRQNIRTYRFEGLAKGEAPQALVVTVDMTLFRVYRVGIQEGPMLCAHKLASDLERLFAGDHELTEQDLLAHSAARTAAEAAKAEARRNVHRRRPVA